MAQNRENDELILINASQAWPFVDTLSRLGGPVQSLSRQAGMPIRAVREKRGVIGEHSLWRFVEYASEHTNLEHFGYLTAVEHPVDSIGELGGYRLRMASTLNELLRFFIEDIQAESSGANYSLKRADGQTWFDRVPIFKESGASWQAEQYVIMFVIQVVRLYAGQSWLPDRLRISSQSHLVPVPPEWSPIDIEWGQPTTGIQIGDEVLALQNPNFVEARQRELVEEDSLGASVPIMENLVDRQIWSGELSINKAALELGVSVTTLKRRLRSRGQSYSSIVDNRRHHWAKKLLRERHIPISSIAETLGYTHSSNFCRAFSRICGTTPSAFRRSAGDSSQN